MPPYPPPPAPKTCCHTSKDECDCPAPDALCETLIDSAQATGDTAAVTLATAAALISGERHHTYGSALEDFTRTGRLWAALLGVDHIGPEKVALCMAALKMSRLCHSPGHNDSWIDLCGYAGLGAQVAGELDECWSQELSHHRSR